ncbi:MAG: diguanylate cyclase [Aphanothece sp. CMT-3BRIN-NPC111]|jgi:diguanylate cyclase (GGDEF)-like protein|nr:diguanylate cyclase [Aphanothece sp. CMT-3BRIN-NPC111]
MTKKKILIVEDEKIVAKDIARTLLSLGYFPFESIASGEEALKKIAILQPDLVLMDISLKGNIDGIETAHQIRNIFNIPVVYLTAYADQKTVERAKKTRALGYIVKPFDERDLHTTIEIALSTYAVEESIREQNEELLTTSWAAEELKRQNLRTQLLAEITLKIRQYWQLEEILQTTVTEVRNLLQVDRVLIYQLSANGTGSVVTEEVVPGRLAILGQEFSQEVFPKDLHELYRQERIRTIEDVEKANVAPCLVKFLQQFEVKAKLVVPILLEEELWGLLVAHHCTEPRQWSKAEIELLKQLADQVSIALAQSQLLEARFRAQAAEEAREELEQEILERQRVEEALRQQAEMAHRIRLSLDLNEILNTTVAEVRQFLQSDRVFIYRFEADWSGVVTVESVTPGWISLLGMKITDSYFVETRGQPYQKGRIQATADIYTAGLNQCHIDLLAQLQIRANLVVPILQGEQLWGLLVAQQCSGPRQWQQLEIDLLNQLATQVGIAIQQSELYQQLQEANLELRQLVSLDKVTQIANRHCFDAYLDKVWQQMVIEEAPLSVIMCDIDFFKTYNDTYGHQTGDSCLQQVARAISEVIHRPSDLVARYGGEEFAVILPNTPAEGAVRVAESIHSQIQALKISHINSPQGQLVTLSLGVASIIPPSETSPARLIAAADRALYKAKAQGRDCVVLDAAFMA